MKRPAANPPTDPRGRGPGSLNADPDVTEDAAKDAGAPPANRHPPLSARLEPLLPVPAEPVEDADPPGPRAALATEAQALASGAAQAPSSRAGAGFHAAPSRSVLSATLLLSVSSLLSGLLGLVRTKYVAHVFGAGPVTDAYTAAFQLPDMIGYFLVGGVASITLVNLLNRYREAGDEAGADRTLSVVLVAMTAVLGSAILLAELLAPLYTRTFFGKLDPATAALCTHLTRLLLPAQLFFFSGGVLGSRLLVRKVFIFQAITPLLYNIGILLGGWLLSARLGIDALAWGVLAGALVGSTLLNLFAAFRSGLRFTFVLNLRHPAFVEWLRLSLPLMIGVSLAMADKWILGFYGTADHGALTRLNNAKALFNAPLTIVGAAAGSASLPFFSSLYAQGRAYDFNQAVSRSVSQLLAVAALLTAWMVALAGPIVGVLRGGSYTPHDVLLTARYFVLFSLSLALWSAQGIYARAFYAARNTLTPAISGTVVTLVSIPVYGWLFGRFGVEGLAVASDLGILAHTLALAVLLHRARLVSLVTLEWRELARALAAAVCAGGLAAALSGWMPHVPRIPLLGTHTDDLARLLAGSAVWAAAALAVLVVSGSRIPRVLLRRRG